MTSDIDARRKALRDRFPVWEPFTLDAWLDHCADLYGDRPLVLTDEVELSCAEVAAQSRRLADGLVAFESGSRRSRRHDHGEHPRVRDGEVRRGPAGDRARVLVSSLWVAPL
jgi:hypothetical protein